MTRKLTVGVFVAALLGAGSASFAQRDGADRSQRLDSEEFRNDIAQQRLTQPAPPPSQQPAATSDGDGNKPIHTKKKK